jgi:hypothetical protein
MPSRVVDRRVRVGRGEVLLNHSQLLDRLSTRTCMKYRNRPKSAGNFTLSFAIQSLVRLENINHDLFCIGSVWPNHLQVFKIVHRQIRSGGRSAK